MKKELEKIWRFFFPLHEWNSGRIVITHRKKYLQQRCKFDDCYAVKKTKI